MLSAKLKLAISKMQDRHAARKRVWVQKNADTITDFTEYTVPLCKTILAAFKVLIYYLTVSWF